MDRKQLILEQIEQAGQVLNSARKTYYQQHFYEFNRDILGWPDLYEPLHKRVCDFVQDNWQKKKLLILLPRGTFKSSIITVGFSLWRIAVDANVRILISNATYPMAVSFLGQIKKHILGNTIYKDVFGEMYVPSETWREDRISVSTEKLTHKEPTIWAYGMGGNLVGSHFNLAILDDVVARENIGTKEQIEKTKNFYRDALDLIDPSAESHKPMIIIGTTWHYDDLYAWLMDKKNNLYQDFAILKLPAYEGEWGKGKLLFPGRLNWKTLENLKNQQGEYHFCTPYESPVIMGNLSVKQIGEIKEGDEILGWDDNSKPKAILKKTRVLKVHKYKNYKLVEIKMLSGKKVLCTPEHKWYTARDDETHRRYKPAKVGSRMMFVLEPKIPKLTKEQKERALWLGGMFDGEGSCIGSIVFAQDSEHNHLIWNKIRESLEILNIDYSIYEKTYDTDNPRFRHKSMIWLKGGKQGKMNFVNWCKPFKKEDIVNSVIGKSNFIQLKDKVVNIKELPFKRDVYALETETGNYVVWGFASSNSAQYMLNPVPEKDQVFKPPFKYYEDTDLRGIELNKFMAIDPALSEAKYADYSAIVVVGVDKNDTWYILDLWRDQCQPSELISQIFYMDEKWKPISIGLETTAYQRILQYAIINEMKTRSRYLAIKELKHAGINSYSKEDRIRSLQPRFDVGNIFLPERSTNKFVEYLEDELARFPRGQHDDLVDSMASLNELAFPKRQKEERRTFGIDHYPA